MIKSKIKKFSKQNPSSQNLKKKEELTRYHRDQFVEKLLNTEKIMTLIYDKTFFNPDFHKRFCLILILTIKINQKISLDRSLVQKEGTLIQISKESHKKRDLQIIDNFD